MNHVKAYANTAIATPIRVAATRDGGFVVTNHESTKRRCLGAPTKIIRLIWHK